ncbi:uncharacterized protein LOC115158486 [Salmo trutta]|uniref:uncharacterized protein LOC115158486 n=1 Tax=Salmo trutta TaxID=8032 RepID=UPI001130235F|nr:uncharacterized protein LOC115158486 [Salmo trutta]
MQCFEMIVLAVAVFAMLSPYTVGSVGNASSVEFNIWKFEDQPLVMQLAAVYKEMEHFKCEQTNIRQQLEALNQMLTSPKNETTTEIGSTSLVYPPNHGEEDIVWSSEEEDSMRPFDPCFRYTVLDQPWRATNTSIKNKMCDRNVKWRGWYRLFYKGNSLQMPERCVPMNKCGTHAPMWLAGPHPKRRDGIVTRKVCGHWNKNCCAFKSTPIKVKKCQGNYYVYKFTKPTTCHLAYCADINTIVCGKCRKSETCVSRDNINWRCKKKPRPLKRKVHFFASYPGPISGKVNRIKYRTVLVNVGRAFNRRTGVFRAPVKGVYQFFFSTQSGKHGVKTDLWLVINGYWVAVSHTKIRSPSTVGNLSTYMTFLRRGSLVYVSQDCGSSWATASSNTITFGGSLLVQSKR